MITKMSRIVNSVIRTQFGEIICHIVNSTINFREKDTSAREKNIVMLVFLDLERRLNVSVRRETFPLINKAKLNNNNKNALLWSQKKY